MAPASLLRPSDVVMVQEEHKGRGQTRPLPPMAAHVMGELPRPVPPAVRASAGPQAVPPPSSSLPAAAAAGGGGGYARPMSAPPAPAYPRPTPATAGPVTVLVDDEDEEGIPWETLDVEQLIVSRSLNRRPRESTQAREQRCLLLPPSLSCRHRAEAPQGPPRRPMHTWHPEGPQGTRSRRQQQPLLVLLLPRWTGSAAASTAGPTSSAPLGGWQGRRHGSRLTTRQGWAGLRPQRSATAPAPEIHPVVSHCPAGRTTFMS